jgi:hypothetical protein
MNTSRLPPGELAAFTKESGKLITPRVKRARSGLWCSQPLNPEKAAYEGAVYQEGGDMLGSVPFRVGTALFKAALAQGAALRLIGLAGLRQKKDFVWRVRAFAEEEQRALRGVVAPASDLVVAAMRAAKALHRTPVRLYIGTSSMKLRGLVMRFSAWSSVNDLPVSDALAQAVATLRGSYAHPGLCLLDWCKQHTRGEGGRAGWPRWKATTACSSTIFTGWPKRPPRAKPRSGSPDRGEADGGHDWDD